MIESDKQVESNLARIWAELEKEAEQAHILLDEMNATAERDLKIMLDELAKDTSLADMLAEMEKDTSLADMLAEIEKEAYGSDPIVPIQPRT